jgi:hypothetical protein
MFPLCLTVDPASDLESSADELCPDVDPFGQSFDVVVAFADVAFGWVLCVLHGHEGRDPTPTALPVRMAFGSYRLGFLV